MRLRGPALVVLASMLSIQIAEPTFPSKRVGWDVADLHATEAYDLGDTIDVFCLECHDARRAVGGVDLEALARDPSDLAVDPDLVLRVRDRLRARDMPPLVPGESATDGIRPDDDEYRRAIAATGAILATRARDGGVPPVTVGRLGRRALRGSIVDLFGDFPGLDEAVEALPPDDVGHGFDHLGEVLSTSPIHVEKFFDLAELVARRVVIDPDVPVLETIAVPPSGIRGGSLRRGGSFRPTRGEMFAHIELPRPGRYRLEFDLAGQQAGPEPVRFGLRVDRRTIRTVEVPEGPDEPATHSIEFEAADAVVRAGAVFLNDYHAPKDPDPSQRDRNAYLAGIRLIGPLDPGDPTGFQAAFDATLKRGDRRTGVARAMRDLLERAWSRRLSSDEAFGVADRVIRAATEASGTSRPSNTELLRAAVIYTIVSPEFLYRTDSPVPDAVVSDDGTVPLDGHSIAARLAAFLRGGPPDESLIEAARRGRLDREDGIVRHARRLLRTEGARVLAERFAVQWLHIDGVERLEPDPARFGVVRAEVLRDMREETVRAFEEIVVDGRPVTDLLRSGTTWLSPRLAAHYGWDPDELGLEGDAFQRVDLVELGIPQAELGILRHGSVLASTSNSTRTSPVKRGKWVLESLLDSPPPPPPPGVDQLPDAPGDLETPKSLRAMLEAHRADADCAACHLRMDALGFAMESLDGVGRWRDRDGGNPIDSRATLPDGTDIDGVLDLRDVLVADPALLRSFAKHLLVYALGRGPRWQDEPLIDSMVVALREDPTVETAVECIVLSDAFRRRPASSSQETIVPPSTVDYR